MRLTVRLVDIAARGILLHLNDAKSLGVLTGDRVVISSPSSGKVTADYVETTTTLIEQGRIGVYHHTNELLELTEGGVVDVSVAGRPVSLDYIKKKMEGEKLNREDIRTIVTDIVQDRLSPSEITAFVVSSYINQLDMDEIESLTRAMVETGDQIEFHSGPIVDKHSIGGVPGNKISLIVVPIIAASGLLIPKTSSRAITGAGGTADLMEVLAPVEFSASEVQEMTIKTGGVIVWGGATNIAPADDKIIIQEYPFKIDQIGQMIASVMAKKFAVGADVVAIDIPVGKYCKVHSIEEGRKLARQFIELGERLNMRVECALTYGDAPVGRAIGPKLEIKEALSVLEGSDSPRSLIQKSCVIAGIALELAGKANRGEGANVALEILQSGKALQKFQEIIKVQGGKPDIASAQITAGEHFYTVRADSNGYVIDLNNHSLITIARTAGAPADHGAGLYLHAKHGTSLSRGDPIFTIYADRKWRLEKAIEIARRLRPVIVEGMLIDRVPNVREWLPGRSRNHD
ncbi:AMP phosphorylase [Methanospirillum sp. J.3.6.1-F.2.7.3]|uniref:AMP phosphorylase n=1 Tax=Methanospirillum purgamenti TaxID=2834276 RepID=A0A8E7B1Q6_9EURY|nr:AMP phosphorylase [Methanospirillum sp. J.3.6.1-F.2.7.3]QVV88746.1 AMP phosphorylase [Methanospirillum sp. J.3.6.1-F.2.7.3]